MRLTLGADWGWIRKPYDDNQGDSSNLNPTSGKGLVLGPLDRFRTVCDKKSHQKAQEGRSGINHTTQMKRRGVQ